MKQLSRRDFLKLTALAIAGAAASQIHIEEKSPEKTARAGRFVDSGCMLEWPRPWDQGYACIGKNAGKECDDYTVLIGTTAKPFVGFHNSEYIADEIFPIVQNMDF